MRGGRAHQAPDAEKGDGGARRRRHLGRAEHACAGIEARDLREGLDDQEQRFAADDLRCTAAPKA